jgi:hypothetical protein
MIEYVLLGRTATIRAQHNRPTPAAQAAVKLYRPSKSGGQTVLVTDTIPLTNGAGAYPWPSTGLEPDEMSCPVYWEVKIEDRLAGQGAFVVYRDRIEVLVVDAANPANPLAHALSHMAAACDRDWATETHYAGPADLSTDQASGIEGTLDFPGLPLGRHEITFRPPYFLKEWKVEDGFTKTGPRRKALVEKRYCATFVSPLAGGDTPVRQWVNLDPNGANDDAQRGEKGSAVTVQVRVRQQEGGGLAGDKIWVRATWSAENSERTGDPRPMFDGEAATRGGTHTREYTLAADGAVIDIPVELGQAGGDRLTIVIAGHAGLSDTTFDEKLVFETWRRVWLQPVSPNGVNAIEFRDDLKELAKGALEPAFIDLAIPRVPLRFDAPASMGCRTVTGDIAEGMKLPADATNVIYTFSKGGAQSDVAKAFEAAYNNSSSCPAYPPTVFVVLGQGMFHKGDAQTFRFKVRGRGPHRIEATSGFFLQRDWTGNGTVLPLADSSPSHWKSGDQRIPVTAEYLTPEGTHLTANFAIPDGVDARPGMLSRDEFDVELRVQTYGAVAGSAAGRWLAFWFNRDSLAARAGYALVHEIGHTFGHAPVTPSARGLGPEARNELAYQYSGPHCSTGVPNLDRTNTTETTSGRDMFGQRETRTVEKLWSSTVDWQAVIDGGRQGSCVMFSPVGSKTKYPAQPAFCDVCLKYLKAADLRRITR